MIQSHSFIHSNTLLEALTMKSCNFILTENVEWYLGNHNKVLKGNFYELSPS